MNDPGLRRCRNHTSGSRTVPRPTPARHEPGAARRAGSRGADGSSTTLYSTRQRSETGTVPGSSKSPWTGNSPAGDRTQASVSADVTQTEIREACQSGTWVFQERTTLFHTFNA